jgi:hypothetical protein
VFKTATRDKAILDRSGVVGFITYRNGDRQRHHAIIGDLGYVEMTRTGPNAILPHKYAQHEQLTKARAVHNQAMGRDRILVENFFGRWKSLFKIYRKVYSGDGTRLRRIVRITICPRNFSVTSHLQRALAPAQPLTDDEEGGEGPAFPLD